jgi:hypothetical protein
LSHRNIHSTNFTVSTVFHSLGITLMPVIEMSSWQQSL